MSCKFGQSVLSQDTPQQPPFPGSATRTWGEAGRGQWDVLGGAGLPGCAYLTMCLLFYLHGYNTYCRENSRGYQEGVSVS